MYVLLSPRPTKAKTSPADHLVVERRIQVPGSLICKGWCAGTNENNTYLLMDTFHQPFSLMCLNLKSEPKYIFVPYYLLIIQLAEVRGILYNVQYSASSALDPRPISYDLLKTMLNTVCCMLYAVEEMSWRISNFYRAFKSTL